jgi:hypothetical protein
VQERTLQEEVRFGVGNPAWEAPFTSNIVKAEACGVWEIVSVGALSYKMHAKSLSLIFY